MDVKGKHPLIFGVPGENFYKKFCGNTALVAEIRPSLEGTTQVAPALLVRHCAPIIICDNMMAFCMERGLVDSVTIFYEKKKKGVLVCRTGSLIAALCAKAHKIPVSAFSAGATKKKKMPLTKIMGMNVVKGKFKTYVPRLEDVPVGLVGEINHG